MPGVNETLMFAGQPIFADREVRWLGEPIFLVLAPDKRTARELPAQVKIYFEELPALMTFDEAIEKATPYMDWQTASATRRPPLRRPRAWWRRESRPARRNTLHGAAGRSSWQCRARTAASQSTPSCQGPVIIRDGVAKTPGCAPELVNAGCLPWAAVSAARKTRP